MLSKHEASHQQFPNLKIEQPFGSSQKKKTSKNQQLFSLLQQCQTLAKKKKKTSTSFPFPPTSGAMLGVTVEVVGVTTPFVVGCSFAFLLQTVTSSCFVRQRFRDCTEGGVLSTSRFFSPWRVGGLGVGNGGKGYQGIEVVSKSFHPKFLRRFMRSNVRLSRRYFLVGEVGKKKLTNFHRYFLVETIRGLFAIEVPLVIPLW